MANRLNLNILNTIILISLIKVNCSEINSINLNYLEKVNFVVGIYQNAVRNSNNPSQCIVEMKGLLSGLENRDVWALKLIDAFGTTPKSFIWGNNFWYSSMEHCTDLNSPYKISSSNTIKRDYDLRLMNSTSPYPVEFRMIYFNFTSKLQFDMKMQYKPKIQIGLCSPKSCEDSEIMEYASEYFRKKIFIVQETMDVSMTPIGTKVPKIDWSFLADPAVIAFAVILAVIGVLSFVAEVMRLIDAKRVMNKGATKPSDTALREIIACFQLKDNLKATLRTDASEGFLSVIAGIRTIVCLWVIMFHVQYHSLFTINNATMFFAKLDSFLVQPFLQSCLYVDVFFVISAFLLVYNFLSNKSIVQAVKYNSFLDNMKLYLRYFGNRYVRLTCVFGITTVVSQVFYSGLDMCTPFAMTSESDLYCRDTWWHNLLYINNFIHQSIMCASWGWYLACEMQFYLGFLLLLFTYVKNEAVAKAIFIISAITFSIISFGCNYFHGLTFQSDVMYNTMEHLYVKPYVRINPYFGGCLMAWVLYRSKTKEIKINPFAVATFWTLAFTIYLVTIFMSYWKEAPVWVVSAIMSFGRLAFGILVGSVIVLCQLGYGGFFKRAMSAKICMFLNKFSFSMYMVGPIAISVIFSVKGEANRFNEVTSLEDMMLTMLSTFLGAFLVVVFIEIPCQRLSKAFILKRL